MTRTHTSLTKALPIFAACAIIFAVNPAAAGDHVNLKKFTFNTQNVYNQVVEVYSTDKKKWNAIKPGSVNFGAYLNVKTQKHGINGGWLDNLHMVLGQCASSSCYGKPVLLSKGFYRKKSYVTQNTINVSTKAFPVSTNGIATTPFGDQIVAQCNTKLSALGPTTAHEFNYFLKTTLVVDTKRKRDATTSSEPLHGNAPWFTQLPTSVGVDHSKTASFLVKVKCIPVELETAEDVPDDPNYGSKGPKVFISTFSHAVTKPTQFKTCKKGRILARIETTKPGPTKFNLWTKIGNQPAQRQFVAAWSSKKGGIYKAEYKKWISVDKTTHVQAMVEDLTNPISQSTGWKDITLKCQNSGGNDGLADLPNPNDDVPVFTKLKVKGEISVLDKQKSLKPRPGTVLFKLKANKPGALTYRIRCTGGRGWKGTLQPSKVGPGKYQVVSAHQFKVSKTEKVNCRLRNLTGKRKRILDKDGRFFKVAGKPNFEGAGDLSKKPTPTHKKPKRVFGTKLKAKKIACIGGKKVGRQCFCPARTVRKKVKPNTYHCVKQVAKPKRPKLFKGLREKKAKNKKATIRNHRLRKLKRS